jgi:cytoskeleton protein RodZ
MTDPAASVGARLKAERERRNLSSQKAADELHLDGWVVDALEAEDYERIGPSVYAKGHLKRYAALLGLPADEIMQGYEARARVPKPQASQAIKKMPSDAPPVSNLPWPQVMGSIAVALLVIGVLWWKPWHQRGSARAARPPPAAVTAGAGSADGAGNSGASVAEAEESPPPASASTPANPSPAAAPTTPSALPGSAAGTAAVQAAASDTNSMASTGRARLRLSFSADSWVDVHDAAGRRAFAGNGRANSVKTIAGMAPMRVYLGFASGVQLEINNRAVAIGPQFLAGDVARFEAGADGVLRRDSHSAAAPGAAGASPGVQSRNARPTG